MGTEEIYDLLRVFMFLGAQEAVVEDPVVGFAVFGKRLITAYLARRGEI